MVDQGPQKIVTAGGWAGGSTGEGAAAGFICIDGDGDGDGGRAANYTRGDGWNGRANILITAPRNEER